MHKFVRYLFDIIDKDVWIIDPDWLYSDWLESYFCNKFFINL